MHTEEERRVEQTVRHPEPFGQTVVRVRGDAVHGRTLTRSGTDYPIGASGETR